MQRGQLSLEAVIGIVAVLVAVIVGGVAFSGIFSATEKQTSGTGTTHTWTLTIDNTGTDNLAITEYDGIRTGTLTVNYSFSSSVALMVKLNGENIIAGSYSGENTIENNVLAYLTGGTNTLQVSVDNQERITSLRTTLNATSYEKSVGEKTGEDIGSVGAIVFTIMPVLALVGVLFAFLAMMRR